MKYSKYIVGILLLFPQFIFAQKTAFTLQECIDYALKQDENLKNYRLDQRIAEENIKQTKSKNYPQINGVVDVRDNIKLQTSVLPFNPSNEPGAVQGLTPVQFGTKYNATVAVEGNYTFFDPNIKNTLKNQAFNAQIAENNYQQRQRDIIINLKKNYYVTLLNQEKIKYNQASVQRTQKFYEDAQTLVETKQLQAIETSRALYELKNQQAELSRAQQQYMQSILQLKYNMGYPMDSEIELAETDLLSKIEPQLQVIDNQVNNRLEYQNLLLQKNQEEFNLRKVKKSYLPTLSLYGYAGTQAFRQKFDIFSFNQPWFGVGYMGVRANIPIFDGFLKKSQANNARLLIEKKNNEVASFSKQYAYEIQYNNLAIQNSLQNITIQKNNLQLAKEVLDNTQNRFQSGLALAKDVIDAELKFTQAQTNYLTALNDYWNAKLDLEKVSWIK